VHPENYRSLRFSIVEIVNPGNLSIFSVELTYFLASRFIIDTLNDSVVDLPEEAWEKLDRYLRPESQDQEK
jgi:hypothetical protein